MALIPPKLGAIALLLGLFLGSPACSTDNQSPLREAEVYAEPPARAQLTKLLPSALKLLSEGASARRAWSGVTSGRPIGVWTLTLDAARNGVWRSLTTQPAYYLVPVVDGHRSVAEYRIEALSHGEQWTLVEVDSSASDSAAIDEAIELVSRSSRDSCDVRVIAGPWTTVLARDASGAMSAVFVLPRFGGLATSEAETTDGVPDGLVTSLNTEWRRLNQIREGVLYTGPNALRQVRLIYPGADW